MFKHGTTAIHNIQTGQYTPTPLGQVRPSECDLHEHEEVVVWDENELKWVQCDTETIPRSLEIITNIRAFIGAIEDELDELEGLL